MCIRQYAASKAHLTAQVPQVFQANVCFRCCTQVLSHINADVFHCCTNVIVYENKTIFYLKTAPLFLYNIYN